MSAMMDEVIKSVLRYIVEEGEIRGANYGLARYEESLTIEDYAFDVTRNVGYNDYYSPIEQAIVCEVQVKNSFGEYGQFYIEGSFAEILGQMVNLRGTTLR